MLSRTLFGDANGGGGGARTAIRAHIGVKRAHLVHGERKAPATVTVGAFGKVLLLAEQFLRVLAHELAVLANVHERRSLGVRVGEDFERRIVGNVVQSY